MISPRIEAGTASAQAEPLWQETLGDGRSVRIRPLHRDDEAFERAFLEGLSPQTRRQRFLGTIAAPSDELVHELVDVDFVHHVALAAIADDERGERLVGVSRYALAPDGSACECAVTVADDWQHVGLGTRLMRHLIDIARARGVRRMRSIDAAANADMRPFAANLGFTRHSEPGDACEVVYTLDLGDAPAG